MSRDEVVVGRLDGQVRIEPRRAGCLGDADPERHRVLGAVTVARRPWPAACRLRPPRPARGAPERPAHHASSSMPCGRTRREYPTRVQASGSRGRGPDAAATASLDLPPCSWSNAPTSCSRAAGSGPGSSDAGRWTPSPSGTVGSSAWAACPTSQWARGPRTRVIPLGGSAPGARVRGRPRPPAARRPRA